MNLQLKQVYTYYRKRMQANPAAPILQSSKLSRQLQSQKQYYEAKNLPLPPHKLIKKVEMEIKRLIIEEQAKRKEKMAEEQAKKKVPKKQVAENSRSRRKRKISDTLP